MYGIPFFATQRGSHGPPTNKPPLGTNDARPKTSRARAVKKPKGSRSKAGTHVFPPVTECPTVPELDVPLKKISSEDAVASYRPPRIIKAAPRPRSAPHPAPSAQAPLEAGPSSFKTEPCYHWPAAEPLGPLAMVVNNAFPTEYATPESTRAVPRTFMNENLHVMLTQQEQMHDPMVSLSPSIFFRLPLLFDSDLASFFFSFSLGRPLFARGISLGSMRLASRCLSPATMLTQPALLTFTTLLRCTPLRPIARWATGNLERRSVELLRRGRLETECFPASNSPPTSRTPSKELVTTTGHNDATFLLNNPKIRLCRPTTLLFPLPEIPILSSTYHNLLLIRRRHTLLPSPFPKVVSPPPPPHTRLTFSIQYDPLHSVVPNPIHYYQPKVDPSRFANHYPLPRFIIPST